MSIWRLSLCCKLNEFVNNVVDNDIGYLLCPIIHLLFILNDRPGSVISVCAHAHTHTHKVAEAWYVIVVVRALAVGRPHWSVSLRSSSTTSVCLQNVHWRPLTSTALTRRDYLYVISVQNVFLHRPLIIFFTGILIYYRWKSIVGNVEKIQLWKGRGV